MKNYEILNLQKRLSEIQFDKFEKWKTEESRFNLLYFIAKEKAKLQKISDQLKSTLVVPKELTEFQEKVNEINLKYCNRDESGKPKLFRVGSSEREIYDIPLDLQRDSSSVYNEEIKALRAAYTPIIEKYNTEIERYNKFLQENNNEYKVPTITVSLIPLDISQEGMDILLFFREADNG